MLKKLLVTAAAAAAVSVPLAGVAWAIVGPLLGVVMAVLAWRFRRQGDRPSARKLFLFTLLYLPLALGLLAIAWR